MPVLVLATGLKSKMNDNLQCSLQTTAFRNMDTISGIK